MENSENASINFASRPESDGKTLAAGLLPFSGLGFDLGPVLARRIRVMTVESAPRIALPSSPCVPLPSGRRLQLAYGREIRGR